QRERGDGEIRMAGARANDEEERGDCRTGDGRQPASPTLTEPRGRTIADDAARRRQESCGDEWEARERAAREDAELPHVDEIDVEPEDEGVEDVSRKKIADAEHDDRSIADRAPPAFRRRRGTGRRCARTIAGDELPLGLGDARM